MDRVIMAVLLGVSALCLGLTVKNYFGDPQKARMDVLAKHLNEIQPRQIDYVTQSHVDYASLQNQILGNPSLFQELIAPPPPPPVAPPPPPKPPDLDALLKGVVASRMEISKGGVKRVRFMTPASKVAEYFGAGDVVNGVTIKEITKEAVLFAIVANGKEYTKAIARQ